MVGTCCYLWHFDRYSRWFQLHLHKFDCHRVCLLVLVVVVAAVVAAVGMGFEIHIAVVDSGESLEGSPDYILVSVQDSQLLVQSAVKRKVNED